MNDPATPVSLDIGDPVLAHQVARHLESHLGWQVIDDSTDLPVRLRLTDRPADAAGAVLVMRDPCVDDVRRAVAAGAIDVVAWPGDADRLADAVPVRRDRLDVDVLVVRGSAGGVGTSTVALGIAASRAWAGRPTWLVADGRARRLAGVAEEAAPVASCEAVPGLHMVRHARDLPGRTGPGDLVVVDAGVADRGQVLVARPDGDLPRAVSAGRPRLVVTVGTGGLRRDEVARIVGGLPHLPLRWDVRVSRAGLRGRLPGGFPGRYLADLGAAVAVLGEGAAA